MRRINSTLIFSLSLASVSFSPLFTAGTGYGSPILMKYTDDENTQFVINNGYHQKQSRCQWPFGWKYATGPESDESSQCRSTRFNCLILGGIAYNLAAATDLMFAIIHSVELADKTNNAPQSFCDFASGFCSDNPCQITSNVGLVLSCCWMCCSLGSCCSEKAWDNGEWCNRCVRKK